MPGGRAAEGPRRTVAGHRLLVRAEGAVQSLDGLRVALLGLLEHGHLGEAAARVRFDRVRQAELGGEQQEAPVVVAAGSRGVPDVPGRGQTVGSLVEEPLETEPGATGRGGFADQGLGRGQVGEVLVVGLDVTPGGGQFGREDEGLCRAHARPTMECEPMFRMFSFFGNSQETPRNAWSRANCAFRI